MLARAPPAVGAICSKQRHGKKVKTNKERSSKRFKGTKSNFVSSTFLCVCLSYWSIKRKTSRYWHFSDFLSQQFVRFDNGEKRLWRNSIKPNFSRPIFVLEPNARFSSIHMQIKSGDGKAELSSSSAAAAVCAVFSGHSRVMRKWIIKSALMFISFPCTKQHEERIFLLNKPWRNALPLIETT